MRSKVKENRKTCTKRKMKSKNTKIEYEQMSQNSHFGGSSFTVNKDTNRLLKWKKLLFTRYYVHLGNRSDIDVNYKSIVDRESNEIEERYKISTTGKEKISLSLTIYHSTGRILIQGNNEKEWIKNEYEKLKKIVDLADTEEEIDII